MSKSQHTDCKLPCQCEELNKKQNVKSFVKVEKVYVIAVHLPSYKVILNTNVKVIFFLCVSTTTSAERDLFNAGIGFRSHRAR